MKKYFILWIVIATWASSLLAQEIKKDSMSIHVDQLPEYIIVTSEARNLFGGIWISIETKGSNYEKELSTLRELLIGKDKLQVKTQTDLLNILSELGFEFLDAYTSEDSESSRNRIGMVFRKKEHYRKS